MILKNDCHIIGFFKAHMIIQGNFTLYVFEHSVSCVMVKLNWKKRRKIRLKCQCWPLFDPNLTFTFATKCTYPSKLTKNAITFRGHSWTKLTKFGPLLNTYHCWQLSRNPFTAIKKICIPLTFQYTIYLVLSTLFKNDPLHQFYKIGFFVVIWQKVCS